MINSVNYIELEAWVVIEQGGTICIGITENGNAHLIQISLHSINILVSGLINFTVLD